VVVDNCKTAVLRWEENRPVFNPAYAEFAAYHGFRIVACRRRTPTDKGVVENTVRYVKGNFLNGRSLDPYHLLNPDVRDWLVNVANVRLHATTRRRPVDLYQETDRPLLSALPILPYDCSRWLQITVSKFFRITFETNRYSVPAEFVGESVRVRVGVDRIDIYHDERLIATHRRWFGRHDDRVLLEHEGGLLKQRKRAGDTKLLRQFLRLTPAAHAFYQALQDRTPQPMQHIRRILALVDHYTPEAVALAIDDACANHAYNSDCLQNILYCRSRAHELPEPGPLHVNHKQDLLKLRVPTPDLSVYRKFSN
jgi:hypothetical protein